MGWVLLFDLVVLGELFGLLFGSEVVVVFCLGLVVEFYLVLMLVLEGWSELCLLVELVY